VKRFILGILCAISAAAPVLAQAQKDSLGNLIQSGNRKAALERIRAGADVNEPQADGTRPIHWAVYRADYELVEALIAKKARVNVTNEFGGTPLAEAVKLADARLVKMLLDAGSGPEGANEDGQTALMLAIKTGDLSVVKMLVDAGANVNAVEKVQNQTPLMWAAAATRNAGEMVKLLLSKGADVKARAKYSDWPSQITSEPRAQYRPVGGLTPLLYSARGGCYECVEALVATGANVNAPTPEGVTALMIALDNDHNDVAKFLLDHGANPNVWDWWGRTALYIVVDRKAGGSSGGLGGGARGAGGGRGGARGGAGLGGANARGRTLASPMDIITALLAEGVDVNPQLNMHRPSRGGNSGRFIDPLLNTGCTPLLRAVMANDMEVVRALLDRGASPNITAMGLTPFLVAAGVGTGGRGAGGAGSAPNTQLMDLLLQHGANVNVQVSGTKTYSMRIARSASSNEGMTALHVAVQSGRVEIVRYLLDRGASTKLVDDNGRTPIDLIAGGAGLGARGASAPPAGNPAANPAGARGSAAGPPPGAGGQRGASGANAAEIRDLLQSAPANK
jgi:ankyrin repeat protein